MRIFQNTTAVAQKLKITKKFWNYIFRFSVCVTIYRKYYMRMLHTIKSVSYNIKFVNFQIFKILNFYANAMDVLLGAFLYELCIVIEISFLIPTAPFPLSCADSSLPCFPSCFSRLSFSHWLLAILRIGFENCLSVFFPFALWGLPDLENISKSWNHPRYIRSVKSFPLYTLEVSFLLLFHLLLTLRFSIEPCSLTFLSVRLLAVMLDSFVVENLTLVLFRFIQKSHSVPLSLWIKMQNYIFHGFFFSHIRSFPRF